VFHFWQGGAEISVTVIQTKCQSRNLDIQYSIASQAKRLKSNITICTTMLAKAVTTKCAE
jgi:hypothetical protein